MVEAAFEREKWLKDLEFRERELLLKERETNAREGELAVKKKEAERGVLAQPLTLAIVGATITGLANVFVSYHNGDAQRTLEQSQAEHARIVGAISDTAVAVEKLKFLLNNKLITEEPTRTNIAVYIDQQAQKPQQPQTPSPPPPTPPIAKVSLDSGWLDGGHNQSEVCGGLANQVKVQHLGKDVRIAAMSESNRKDFLGHVTYQYHCQFEVF